MPILPIAWQSYEARSKAFSAQRLINFYAEQGNSGTKSQLVLYQRPALTTFATVGLGDIRGIHVMNGVPFVVSGAEVYTLASDGTSINIGTVGGTGRVVMDDNGTQVAIVANDKGWIATTTTVTEITDPDFRTPSSVTFQDSYFIWTEKDTAVMFRSESFDGFSYDALAFATAEYAPDNLVRIYADHSNLFAMGVDSIEPWAGTGTEGLAFDAIQGTAMDVGLLAKDSVAKIDNSFIFLGSDERGGRTVWRLSEGYMPTRISTHPLEKKWDAVTDPTEAYAFTFRIEGHAFYVLTFPDSGTYAYDASSGLWSEWHSFGQDYWTPLGFVSAFNKRLVADSISNKIYELSLDVTTDDGNDIVCEATSATVASQDNALVRHNFLRIDMESGVGTTSGAGSDPELLMSWADEDGTNFNNWKSAKMGKIGETRKRIFFRRLGLSRSRVYKIRIVEPVKKVVIGAYLGLTNGIWE